MPFLIVCITHGLQSVKHLETASKVHFVSLGIPSSFSVVVQTTRHPHKRNRSDRSEGASMARRSPFGVRCSDDELADQ